jgi:DNA-binding transcriptional LysR family regulator
MIDMIKAMQAFVSVVDKGNFVSAAEILNTSTAAISRQISGLESHLGARLLHRTTRRLSLTDVGQEFYSRSQIILNDVSEAEAIIGEQALQPKGVLRISAPLSYGIHWLGPLLTGFRKRYPELQLDIDLSDRAVDLANEGIDVSLRISRSLTSQLIARKLHDIPMVVSASPTYLQQYGIPKTPEDLIGHKILNYSYLSTGDNWSFTHKNGDKVSIRLHPLVHATNGDILKTLALDDGGIICQPNFILEQELKNGTLIPLLQDWSMDPFTLYAIYLSRKHLSAKVRAFIDYMVEFSNH